MVDIKKFVDNIISDGVITKEEHLKFESLIREDGRFDEAEQQQMERIVSLILNGQVRVVDEED